MTARGLQEREGIVGVDRTFIYPVDLIEDVKATDGKSNHQIAEILAHTQPAKLGQLPVYFGIDKKLIENIGEDPTDDLLDAIQNSIDADRLAVKKVEADIQVSEYAIDTTSRFESEALNALVEAELAEDVAIEDDTIVANPISSLSPALSIRNKSAKEIYLIAKDIRKDENTIAKNAKKYKLRSQDRVKGQKFRKGI